MYVLSLSSSFIIVLLFLEDETDTYLNPELVYYDEDGRDVRISKDEGESINDTDEETYEFAIQEHIETEIIESEDENQKVVLSNDDNQIMNEVSVSSQYVQPMMPFYLSNSSIFTIMNENNEVGVSIFVEENNVTT